MLFSLLLFLAFVVAFFYLIWLYGSNTFRRIRRGKRRGKHVSDQEVSDLS